MKYIKYFESVELYYGQNVFDFFPWYKYPKSIESLPEIDEEMFERVRYSFDSESKFDNMIRVWFKRGDNFIYSFGNMSDLKVISFSPKEGVLRYSGSEFDVESWEQIEKFRLMFVLGRRGLSEEYLEVIDNINFLLTIIQEIEDHEGRSISSSELRIKDISNCDMSSSGEIKSDTYLNFLESYDGDVEILNSLKKYHTSKGLTPRQMELLRTILSDPRSKIEKVYKEFQEYLRASTLGTKTKNNPVLVIKNRKFAQLALDSSKHLGYILLPHSYLEGFFLLVKSNS